MTKLSGDEATILAQVQAIVRETVPEANCELQDYQHQIGCGALDQWGDVQAVKFRRQEWDDEIVRHKAKVLATLIRTGGSSAG